MKISSSTIETPSQPTDEESDKTTSNQKTDEANKETTYILNKINKLGAEAAKIEIVEITAKGDVTLIANTLSVGSIDLEEGTLTIEGKFIVIVAIKKG